MTTNHFRISTFVLLSAAALLFGSHRAHALNMNTYVQAIYQNGFTAGVNLGHTVIASTDLNRINASGAFEARCASPYTGPIVDQRGFGAESLIFGTSVTVTVPATLPAVRDMPGFDQVPGAATLACVYVWTADAEEASYSVSVPGLGITIGGRKAHAGSSVPFEMVVPGSGSKDNNGCIH